MTIRKINKASCRILRDAINETLAEISQRHGITFKAGSGSYDDTSVTFKVECVLAGVDKAKLDFEANAFLYDLPEAAYGKKFTSNGVEYVLCGLKPNSPKYPILGKRADGKRFKFTEKAVRKLTKLANVEVTTFDPATSKNLRGVGEVGV